MKRPTPRKKKVTEDELCWMVSRDLRDMFGNPFGVSLAVVPDNKNGWRVVLSKKTRNIERISAAVSEIEQRLRLQYTLV